MHNFSIYISVSSNNGAPSGTARKKNQERVGLPPSQR